MPEIADTTFGRNALLHDPYFKQRSQNRNLPQSVLAVEQHENFVRIVK